MNFKFESNDYKIKRVKKNIAFYKKELKRIKDVNMNLTAYKIDTAFRNLTDKHYMEFSEMLNFYKNKLIQLKKNS